MSTITSNQTLQPTPKAFASWLAQAAVLFLCPACFTRCHLRSPELWLSFSLVSGPMRLRHVYLLLCILGLLVPYGELIPWLWQHGLQPGLLLRELFATRVGAFFGLDVVVSAIVLFVFVFAERAALGIRHIWLPILATLLVGVSAGFPLFLYMRERLHDVTKTV